MISILHLSDLHFGFRSNGESAHYYIKKNEIDSLKLANILIREYEGRAPSVLVVSGDIGWTGSAEDYIYASIFFVALLEEWKSTEFVIVPGNHDYCQKTFSSDAQENYIKFIKGLVGRFPKRNLCESYKAYLDPSVKREDLISYHLVENEKAFIAGVNSSGFLYGEKAEGKVSEIKVDPTCFSEISNYIKANTIDESYFKIFVLHHHLFPFPRGSFGKHSDSDLSYQVDKTIVSNSAELQSWLSSNGFHLVLHGHKHMPHGRKDSLWGRGGKEKKILVVSAGSASVSADGKQNNEAHSYNLINISKLSDKYWEAEINVNYINEEDADDIANNPYSYLLNIGERYDISSNYFQSERLDTCHMAITNKFIDKQHDVVNNFISIVSASDYYHPKTVSIEGEYVEQEYVERCFQVLYPEYQEDKGFEDVIYHAPSSKTRFRFSHSARLFSDNEFKKGVFPLKKAIDAIGDSQGSRSYVSLFDPKIDTFSDRGGPLPGLMSFQFIKSNSVDEKGHHAIDLTVTFRKLELSFWWVVNMYESIKLLDYVVKVINKDCDSNVKYKKGGITFFAALAEWKLDPNPAFIVDIDQPGSVDKILDLLDGEDYSRLKFTIEEKIKNTSDTSLDSSGLKQLSAVLKALVKFKEAPDPRCHDLCILIDKAREFIDSAIRSVNQKERADLSDSAVKELRSAVILLNDM